MIRAVRATIFKSEKRLQEISGITSDPEECIVKW